MDHEPTTEDLPRELADDEDLLGFCLRCYRMRWLRRHESNDKAGNPQGTCRSCAREEAEA